MASPAAVRPLIKSQAHNSLLQHLSSLDIYDEPQNFRKSGKGGFLLLHPQTRIGIICTIGPKTNSVEMLEKLRDAGMNVVRMNFSHGSYEYHGSVIKNTREAEKSDPKRSLAIALDTKGPEIRTGQFTVVCFTVLTASGILKNDEDVLLEKGNAVTITTDEAHYNEGDASKIYMDYKNITKGLLLHFIQDLTISSDSTRQPDLY